MVTPVVMVTVNVVLQEEVAPLLSVARALTEYVPADVQECEALELVPEFTNTVSVVIVSPQSNVYFTWSPSGSVAEVEYE